MKFKKANYLRKIGTQRIWLRARGATAVGYIGCQGVENLGDDAMWIAARGLLGKYLAFTDYCPPNYERRLEQIGLGASKALHGIVLGGGTLINPAWYRQVARAHEQGCPIVTFGTGIGASGFEATEKDAANSETQDWSTLLRAMPMLGLRGPLSLEKARLFGANQAIVTGDLALALTPDCLPKGVRARRVLVNLSLPTDEAEDELSQAARAIAEAADLLAKRGWDVQWVAMTPRDIQDIQLLQKEMCITPKVIHRPKTVEAFFKLARCCQATLAVRLHAAVLSTCVGTAPLLVKYRDKCLDFMSSVGLEANCLSSNKIDAQVLVDHVETSNHSELGVAGYEQCCEMRGRLEAHACEIIERWA